MLKRLLPLLLMAGCETATEPEPARLPFDMVIEVSRPIVGSWRILLGQSFLECRPQITARGQGSGTGEWTGGRRTVEDPGVGLRVSALTREDVVAGFQNRPTVGGGEGVRGTVYTVGTGPFSAVVEFFFTTDDGRSDSAGFEFDCLAP